MWRKPKPTKALQPRFISNRVAGRDFFGDDEEPDGEELRRRCFNSRVHVWIPRLVPAFPTTAFTRTLTDKSARLGYK